MTTALAFAHGRSRSLARRGLKAAAAAALAVALAGCSAPDVHVTVTVPPPDASPEASAPATPGTPSDPGTPSSPAKPSTPSGPAPALPTVGPGGESVVVTRGPVAPECTHTVCYYVHVSWKNLKPGGHDTQCVTDHGDLATWSQSTYKYATADGERDLGCFLGYPGSHVWVVLDGELESAHIVW